jgi:lauroyl/myristoyl acyltransferase
MTKTISATDIYEIFRLPAQALLAWTLPEIAWRGPSRLLGRLSTDMHPTRTRRDMTWIAAALKGTQAAGQEQRIAVEMWANRYAERFQYLRCWRPGGWSPQIEVLGTEHVMVAREKGQGTIFWTGNFMFNDLITKIAFHRLGIAVSQFSRPHHGFSDTQFGIRYLNSVKRGIEDRYLRKRFMVTKRETPDALRQMSEQLRENGAIAFRVGYKGRRRARATFLGRWITLATAPLFIARTTGASLLPTFTLRTAPARFEVTVGAPIAVPQDTHGEPDYAAAIQRYAEMLEPFVLRDPGQWRGWAATRAPVKPIRSRRAPSRHRLKHHTV